MHCRPPDNGRETLCFTAALFLKQIPNVPARAEAPKRFSKVESQIELGKNSLRHFAHPFPNFTGEE